MFKSFPFFGSFVAIVKINQFQMQSHENSHPYYQSAYLQYIWSSRAFIAVHNLTQYQYPPKTKFQLPVPYPWPLKIYTQSYSLPIIKEVDVIVNRMINDLNGDNGDNIAYIRYD